MPLRVQVTSAQTQSGGHEIVAFIQDISGGGNAFTGNIEINWDPSQLAFVTDSYKPKSGVTVGVGQLLWSQFSVPAAGQAFSAEFTCVVSGVHDVSASVKDVSTNQTAAGMTQLDCPVAKK